MAKKYLSLERLTEYDGLLKAEIAAGDESTLESAKSYADEKVALLMNNSSEAVDSIMELAAAMKDNKDVVDALEAAVGNKSDKDHTHDQYLTAVPGEYVTETELNAKGYLTAIPGEYVTETELTNKGYVTTTSLNNALSGKADEGHTHSQYLTSIPGEYVTETELSSKGYLTAIPDEYVTDSELTAKGYATTVYVNEVLGDIESLLAAI